MRLFKTKTRRTSYRPKANRGWSTTLTAKTRAKRWARRTRRKLWRTAKQRIRHGWKKYQRQRPRAIRQRQIARTAQRFRQHNANIHAENDTGTLPGQVKLPPQDGTMATCRRCSNEVQYNGGRGRWEHTGPGHAECFARRRS